MPALYAIAQQPALHEVQAALREGEAIFTYLDDTYIVAAPERVKELYERYRAALWSHARVELNFGKLRIWNAAGEEPRDIADLQQEGGDAVWVGDWSLPPKQQGLVVLGAPIGSEAYVQRQLRLKRDEHDRLLQRIPAVEDLQAAWLLLRHCACPRANYLLRALPPASTAASRALLLSQAGPHAVRVFKVLPTWDEFAVPSSLFRILILRRLRLAPPRPQPLFLPLRVRCAWGPPGGLRHVRCPCISGLALGARHRPCMPGSRRACGEECEVRSSGSRGLPPHACACACGECATCAPSRCATRLGPAVERHHFCGSAARAGLVAP